MKIVITLDVVKSDGPKQDPYAIAEVFESEAFSIGTVYVQDEDHDVETAYEIRDVVNVEVS